MEKMSRPEDDIGNQFFIGSAKGMPLEVGYTRCEKFSSKNAWWSWCNRKEKGTASPCKPGQQPALNSFSNENQLVTGDDVAGMQQELEILACAVPKWYMMTIGGYRSLYGVAQAIGNMG